jgi:hypothetical protein
MLAPRLDEVKLGRVGEPAGDQCRDILGSGALAEARRNERPKLDASAEARRDFRHILGSGRRYEPRPDRRHAAHGQPPEGSRSSLAVVLRVTSVISRAMVFSDAVKTTWALESSVNGPRVQGTLFYTPTGLATNASSMGAASRTIAAVSRACSSVVRTISFARA